MAVTVKKLYKNGIFLYKMNLIAGRSGLTNLVQWVHIIEDDTVSSFLHGNELVFTAGILNRSRDWLLSFARKLHDAGASAFVVNIGPHTCEIPQEVIAYCDEAGMPLFTIPWETKMVDMTRDFCYRIMYNENMEDNAATTIKNILFKVGDPDTQVQQLERYGFQRDSRVCFVSIPAKSSSGNCSEKEMDLLRYNAEKMAKRIHELFLSFTYRECLNLVLVNYSDQEVEAFVRDFSRLAKLQTGGWRPHMGVSSNQAGIHHQSANFEKALSAMDMAFRQDQPYRFYDRLGIYQLLYSVGDKDVLKQLYGDTIGKLEAYDRENKTRLTQLLETYLENNGSLQLASEKQFVHRNTVTNQLKKIEKITGCDPFHLEDKVKLYMGFYIRDLL